MPLRSYWVEAAAVLGSSEKLIPDQQDKLGQVLTAQWLSDWPHFFFPLSPASETHSDHVSTLSCGCFLDSSYCRLLPPISSSALTLTQTLGV